MESGQQRGKGNAAVVERIIEEAWNKNDADARDKVFDPNVVAHLVMPEQPPGLRGVAACARAIRKIFPDVAVRIADTIAQGDLVAYRWTMQGTHRGEHMGIEGTGRQVTVTGMTMYRFQNGMIVESWAEFDSAGLMRQLGLVSEQALNAMPRQA